MIHIHPLSHPMKIFLYYLRFGFQITFTFIVFPATIETLITRSSSSSPHVSSSPPTLVFLQLLFSTEYLRSLIMSGLQLSFVDDLTSAKDLWDIKGKIIRVWRQSFRSDFILLDERGSKIQGCVKNHLYQDFAETLKEDNVVVIRKCGVGVQMDKHRVLPLDHKINLFKCTSMHDVTGFSGDPYGFQFSKFSDLLNPKLTPPISVDVLGKVGYCENLDIFWTNGKEHKRLNFDIEDLEGVVLRVTLWSDYAVDFNKFVSSFDGNQIVVAIQHERIKPFNGARTLRNDMFATRLYINPDFEEAKSFLSSFIEKNGMTSSSTVLSSQTVYPLHNEFVVRTKQKHIQDLNEICNTRFLTPILL